VTLTVVQGGGRVAVPAPVRLVREYKGPLVRDVLAADGPALARLQRELERAAESIEQDEFEAADESLDRALGALLPGPGVGARRARGRRLRRWLWWLGLCALAAGAWAC
jgi:hypothetical protein